MRRIICILLIICLIFSFNCNQTTSPGKRNKQQQEEYDFCWVLLDIFLLFRDMVPIYSQFSSPTTLYDAVNEPYTNYYLPQEAQEILDMLDTQDVGYGIIVDSTTTGYSIEYIAPKSPANDAGLMVGDTIVAVDGASLKNISYDELSNYLEGELGDVKIFTVHRSGLNSMQISVTIGEYWEPAVLVDSLATNTAYIFLSTFLTETGTPGGSFQEFKNALNQTSWAEFTILDLRYNGGGEVQQCLNITSEFFDKDTPLLFSEERILVESEMIGKTISDTLKSLFNGNAIDREFIVLFNEYSASATELLISALRCQREDILLIGETSYGKARGQVVVQTPGAGLAIVTYGRLTPLDGSTYDLVGIAPDIQVKPGEDGVALALEQVGEGLAKQTVIQPKLNSIKAIMKDRSSRPFYPLLKMDQTEAILQQGNTKQVYP